ncbi:MAG TPA: penicillin-binding transpeptidase domain-containing protein, partial [Bacteroidia bacterium]|nr:penicillin-binding transpeptidase domain-containing protein [Bacteroidia bacterium]
MGDTKKDIMWRVWLLYSGVCLFALLIIAQVIRIKFVEGQTWIAKADSLELRMVTINPLRGNVFASDGSLLATSKPIYELRIDTKAEAFKGALFNSKIDSLSQGLATILGDRTAVQYKMLLKQARVEGERYFLLKRNVSYKEYKAIQQLPLFNKGRFKSGLRVITDSERGLPYGVLAARTIGYAKATVKPVGIEGAFNTALSGVVGKRIEQRMAGGVYKPINDENEIEPQDGMDVVSTIDINIQDVAEHALNKQLSKYNAAYGCVVLMEVNTGDVKAIANLKRGADGKYYEAFNYAIGMGSEPGSTFKLASIITALDDNLIDITDTVDVGNGVSMYAGLEMKDSHLGSGKITVQHAFELSSNVGISKVITEAYAKNPKRFTDKLSAMYLDKPLQLQLSGEAKPRIPKPADVNQKFGWSKVTLPFMSIGYETKLAPIQTLTFYNAVANNGKMVKPRFVKEIRQKGTLVKSFETEVLVDSICSSATIAKAKKMMEGVVKQGTATNLKFEAIKIAGKTGTARMAYGGKGYVSNDSIRYQASFC